MKQYPKALAELQARKELAEHAYRLAEYNEERTQRFIEREEKEEEEEARVQARAFRDLAEKIAGGWGKC